MPVDKGRWRLGDLSAAAQGQVEQRSCTTFDESGAASLVCLAEDTGGEGRRESGSAPGQLSASAEYESPPRRPPRLGSFREEEV